MTVGSLFAGIGGFDLGFERAGFEIRWQVEIDPFCRRVLAKHWPNVRRYEDVRTVHRSGLCGTGSFCDGCLEPVDVLCGGFPCQDISFAGPGTGIDGHRSRLWVEYARLIRELRPRFAVVENVSALLARGLGRVLGDLAEIGYDAEWDCLPAQAIGAPHRRDRLWLVAYPDSERKLQRQGAEPDVRRWARDRGAAVADADSARLPQSRHARQATSGSAGIFAGATIDRGGWWATEPNVGRVAHGVPARVDRLRGLGNAVVPQITEWIARQIKSAEGLTA